MSQKERDRRRIEKMRKLGYAKVCRKMPVAYITRIEDFIKERSDEWEKLNNR